MLCISTVVRTVCIVILIFCAEISNLPNCDEIQKIITSVSEIEEIYLITRPDEEYKLTEEDVQKLSFLLTKVELDDISESSEEEESYFGIVNEMFRIVYRNGTQIKFSACYPFYIINSIWYDSGEYPTCYSISHLHSYLLPKYVPCYQAWY